ncbi:hypothetical protein RclHR1_13080003 [Rhizophagus clarus]|uniref:Uncharacterized protein n=1 Tax=Rhizophagus clarus TaxID=94130 RepID=A0A2Z6QLM6_9GLOM|nr:hypothetical protein RclHR1_13080003 [Rhizophagus clarus]
MSEQNLLVSAFQAKFLLKILARLYISKNTKHTGSDFISKVQNSNLKQTEVRNFILRRTTVQNSISRWTTVQNLETDRYFEGLEFRDGPVWNLETDWYFKGPDIPFRRLDSIRRSRVTIFKGHLKTKPGLFEGFGRSISKAGLYLKSRARADQNISKARASCMP